MQMLENRLAKEPKKRRESQVLSVVQVMPMLSEARFPNERHTTVWMENQITDDASLLH